MRLPDPRIDDAAAPAVLDEKPRRRVRIEGGYVVVGVPPERVRHAPVLEYDDTHLGTVMHPAAPVAPGLFALAGLRQVSGRELLHAFILGVEVSCRVGLGV